MLFKARPSLIKKIISFCILGCTVGCTSAAPLPNTEYPLSEVSRQVGIITAVALENGAESTVLQIGDMTVLIDAGNVKDFPSVSRTLSDLGVAAIDCLVVTHLMDTHIGGIQDLLASYTVRSVIIPKWTEAFIAEYPAYATLMQTIASRNIPVRFTEYGTGGKIGEARFVMLGPQGDTYINKEDYAGIIRFTFGGVSYLHMSNAGASAEAELTSGRLVCAADIVRVGPLDNKNTGSSEFTEIVAPKIAIATSTIKKPVKEVVDRYRGAGVELFPVAEYGKVTVATDGRKLGVDTEYYHQPKE